MSETPLFTFPRWSNKMLFVVLTIMGIVPAYLGTLLVYGANPTSLSVGYMPTQPIPYSHAVHVGKLGLDCRYCHSSVEKAGFAAVPPTESCLNCHRALFPESPKLAALVESKSTGKPIPWVKVHDMPDYVYFNHSAHVNAGVGCNTCHGQINQMEVVWQDKPMNMAWCLECHRQPEKFLRPRDQITNMDWKPAGDQVQLGRQLKDKYHVQPNVDCVTCHR
jgi:hypothetical protein